MTETFEAALAGRVAAMADACTRCGKCVEVCPVTGPGGVHAEPIAVISGVLDILRTGDGPDASRKWANACVLTGECIKACDYGVNPRFLLGMARVAMARHQAEPAERRGAGRRRLPQGRARRHPHFAHATRRRDAGAARAEGRQPAGARRGAGFRLLYRLQRAQDAAHRAARARYHGQARRHLSGAGRSHPLLRRGADAHRRHRHLRQVRREHHGQARPQQVGPGGLLVSELPCAVHRDHLAHGREDPRRKTVRDDAVHAVPAQPPRPAAAVPDKARRDAHCAPSPSRHQGRGRGRRGHPAGRARASSSSISRSPQSA